MHLPISRSRSQFFWNKLSSLILPRHWWWVSLSIQIYRWDFLLLSRLDWGASASRKVWTWSTSSFSLFYSRWSSSFSSSLSGWCRDLVSVAASGRCSTCCSEDALFAYFGWSSSTPTRVSPILLSPSWRAFRWMVVRFCSLMAQFHALKALILRTASYPSLCSHWS